MTLTMAQFKSMLRRRMKRAGGVRALARELNVNHGHLCQVLKHAEREPDPAIVAAVGYRRSETRYEST